MKLILYILVGILSIALPPVGLALLVGAVILRRRSGRARQPLFSTNGRVVVVPYLSPSEKAERGYGQ